MHEVRLALRTLYRLDVPASLRRVPESLAEHEHRLREVRVLDERVGPNEPHELGLLHQPVPALEEGQQHIESLGGKGDRLQPRSNRRSGTSRP
jgi:hypothetical protein